MANAEQEETMIRHYFSLNYDYNTILSFLKRNHGIKMSERMLLNRLNEYQLCRRHHNVNEEIVRECILKGAIDKWILSSDCGLVPRWGEGGQT